MHIPAVRRFAAEIVPISVLSGAALLIAAVVRFAIVPEFAALRTTMVQLDYFKSLASDTNRYQTIQDRLTEKQSRLESALHQMRPESDVARTGNLSELLQLLIARAGASDIRFVKMVPQQQTAHGDRIDFPVVLETNASYHSLGRFVSSLEELPDVLRIDRLAITAQKNNLDVRILVTCFLRKVQ